MSSSGDRFVGAVVDAEAWHAVPARPAPTRERASAPLPRSSGGDPAGEAYVDVGWVTPGWYAPSQTARQGLHASLLEQEMLGGSRAGSAQRGAPESGAGSAERRRSRAGGGVAAHSDWGDVEATDSLLLRAQTTSTSRPLGATLAAVLSAPNGGRASGMGAGDDPGASGSGSARRVLSFAVSRDGGSGTGFDDGGSGRPVGTPPRPPSGSSGGGRGSPGGGLQPLSPSGAAIAAAVAAAGNSRAMSLPPLTATSRALLETVRTPARRISKVPFRVLDAPGLADDFYFNLLDWSSLDIIAVALSEATFLYHAQSGRVSTLAKSVPDAPATTSVAWSGRGGHLALGNAGGLVTLYDASTCAPLRVLRGHTARCSALSFSGAQLATGGKDRSILLRDLRSPAEAVGRLGGHRAEICSLRHAPDGVQLASGGNDNALSVWDPRKMGGGSGTGGGGVGGSPGDGGGGGEGATSSARLCHFTQHRSAVKALAWSPHATGLLASGGGTADKHLRFFSTQTGELLDEVDTGSQVCTLTWSTTCDELASTHGFVTHAVAVWRYPSMRRTATLYGHSNRVLYAALSPDGETLLTGAADATLRFWSLFPRKAAGSPLMEDGGSWGGAGEIR